MVLAESSAAPPKLTIARATFAQYLKTCTVPQTERPDQPFFKFVTDFDIGLKFVDFRAPAVLPHA